MKSVRNVPLVVTPHGADILTIPDLHFGMRLNRELDRKISRAIRGADVVTAISRTIEAELANMGAETSRIKFVPNGVDTARFNRQPSAGIRSWLELQDDARLIVSVGKYSPRKGFDFLVRAMPLVLATEPRARLVIVGEHTEALLSLISELRLEGKVALTGGLPPPRHILAGATAGAGTEPDRLAEILCSAEVYVSAATETNAEGLSLALLEGMAAGLPIAATAVSGNVDVVVEGENGALAERADERSLAAAILRILGNRQDHERMRNGARQTALRYAWESAARRYVEAYEQAIAVSRSSTRLSSRRDTESDAV
jgi:glycosyltransferase involved in cell wall biosynthesis